MGHVEVLADLLVVFTVAGVAMLLFQRLRLPAVIGQLVAGVIVGPSGFSLIRHADRVELLAEIGVVALLFTVGLELSLSRLWQMWPLMLKIGLPQVLGSGVVAGAATFSYLGAVNPAIFVGMLVAMSSTAVVLKVQADRDELAAPQGRVAMAVLLFQDLLVVLFMLLVPLLAGHSDSSSAGSRFWLVFVEGMLVVVMIVLAARFLITPLLRLVFRTHNREIFLIVITVLCLGTAALTAATGLSLALGAFLAGLAISESEYAHQTLGEVLPFRDTLASLFFVSVGMLLDLGFLLEYWLPVGAGLLGVLLVKSLAALIPTYLAGFSFRIAILSGLALAQVGEFSFVLASRGLQLGALEWKAYQLFLAISVLSMALTPLLIAIGPRLTDRLEVLVVRLGWQPWKPDPVTVPADIPRKNHVLIAGYGVNGRNLARVLRDIDIPFTVMELNPQTVRSAQKNGEPVVYGDCSRIAVLEHLGIHEARMLVIAISDPATTRRAVSVARQANPHLHLIVRTRYVAEVDELRKLGANEIIPEEFETSIEIFARVLFRYEIPRNLILDLIDRIREGHYEVFRDLKLPATRLELPFDVLSQVQIESCLIRDNSPASGTTLKDLKLRATTGALIMGVRRDGRLLLNPDPDFNLQPGDTAVLIGDRPQVDRALVFLDPELISGQADQPE